MIFWGPPGVGKTTLARLMAHAFSCEFIALSAVFAGVKEIREAMQQAERHRQLGRRQGELLPVSTRPRQHRDNLSAPVTIDADAPVTVDTD